MENKTNINIYPNNISILPTIIFLLILCLLDALLTMHHLGNGFQELNPILEIALKHGGGLWFLIIKFGASIPCIIVLFFNSHLSLAKKGIWFCVIIYSLLLIYHLLPIILSVEAFEKYIVCCL